MFYDILFNSNGKDKIDETVPFAPDVSFDDDGNEYLCLVSPMQENSIANLRAIAQKNIGGRRRNHSATCQPESCC